MAKPTQHSDASPRLDRRKVALFLVLVVIALACLYMIVATLFFARPRTDPQMQNGGHSSKLGPPEAPTMVAIRSRS